MVVWQTPPTGKSGITHCGVEKMKTIGLIGGTGWVSTVEYYRIINETANQRLGGLNSAKCILYSLNYAEIDRLNQLDDMRGVFALVSDAAHRVANAGADCIVLCANTLHFFADDLEDHIALPIIHIATATAKAISEKKLSTVGLLGTRQTMEQDFYKSRLHNENIEVFVPEKRDREFIHNAIMNELLRGIFSKDTKGGFLEIIKKLELHGAEGIVIGCTEIPLLITQDDLASPIFNTLAIHSVAAVDFALSAD
jgi:aspartate racemase